MRIATSATVALILAAAATTSSLATEASYSCDGGTKLTAIFSPVDVNPGHVELLFAGEDGDTVLPQALSADGGRYADDDMEFWIKGNSATLTRAGKTETCEVEPASAG